MTSNTSVDEELVSLSLDSSLLVGNSEICTSSNAGLRATVESWMARLDLDGTISGAMQSMSTRRKSVVAL